MNKYSPEELKAILRTVYREELRPVTRASDDVVLSANQLHNLQMGEELAQIPEVTHLTGAALQREEQRTILKQGKQHIKGVLRRVIHAAEDNFRESSHLTQMARGLGVGVGASFIFSGTGKLLKVERQPVVAQGEQPMQEPPSRARGLIEAAAGAGIVAVSIFMPGGKGLAR